MILGITGFKRSGKDTAADLMVAKYGYRKLSFAGPLKECAKIMYGLNDDEVSGRNGYDREQVIPRLGLSVRTILQKLGSDVCRLIHKDTWVFAMRRELAKPENVGRDIVLSDLRYLNEAALIRDLGGQVWRIHRPGTCSDGHASEEEIDKILADQDIHNNTKLPLFKNNLKACGDLL